MTLNYIGVNSKVFSIVWASTRRRKIMATKKQKHAAALAKREKFLADEREAGLEAQSLDKPYQEMDRQQASSMVYDLGEMIGRDWTNGL